MNSFIHRLKYVKIADILSVFPFFAAVIPALFFKLKHPDLWLICEEKNEARDNGYWFYKYIRENHPEIEAVYAIHKKSPDYQKVKNLGKVIQYGSFVHWIYYLAASKNISSQKGGKPNAALCYVLEIYGIVSNKRIFLQHGITINDSKWLYYDVCKFALFICGAKPEYDYVTEKFGYDKKNITQLLGLCRYDSLDIKKETVNKKQILIMPSWREWLARPVKQSAEYTDDFTGTEYYMRWNSILNNTALENVLIKNNLKAVFYPHRNMQKFLAAFKIKFDCFIVADWRCYDVQTLLNESAFLITDYSSISMDFAYMRKPLVYYQFDQEEFRKAQYQEGYFSYKNNGFGEVVTTEPELITLIQSYIDSRFSLKDVYSSRISQFFSFSDRNNCKRNFESVYNL